MTEQAHTTAHSGASMDRKVTRSPWRRRLLLAAGTTLAVGLAAAVVMRWSGADGRSLQVAGESVTTGAVISGEFDDFTQIRGRFIPLKTIFIDTVQGGQVDAIHVENGALVKRGDLLVELSNTALRLDVISREAQIAEQLNNLRGLELAYEKNSLAQQREEVEVDYQLVRLQRQITRTKPMVASGAVPRSELEDLQDSRAYYDKRKQLLGDSRRTADRLEKAQLVQLRATARQLETNLTVTRQNLDGLEVRALVDGQLTAFDLEVGQSLSPGERIAQLDDPSSYKILADIDEFYLGRVDIGQRADYELGDAKYQLSVAKIRPQVKNGRFQVDLVFDGDAPDKVRRGQTAQARLQLGQPTGAILIPNGAFFNDTGGAWVFVVSPDRSTAIRRKVRLGRRNAQYIEVLEGLTPGEQIVTSAYSGFLEMDTLELTEQP